MKQIMTAGAALLLTTSIATAGGIDRSGQSVGFIFADGDQVQLSFGSVDPSISAGPSALIPLATSDASPRYNPFSLSYKQQLSDDLDMAVIFDQPYGAEIRYTDGPFAGGFADISSEAVTALVNYQIDENFSVHGGLSLERLTGDIASIGLLSASSDWTPTGIIGVAYERPDIALRAALTYRSAAEHDFTGTENFAPTAFTTSMPQSINFDFQTGVAPGTLVTFGARWADWSETELTAGAGTYVNYTDDTVSYRIGVGRQLTDQLAASFTIGYEDGDGTGIVLGPTSGYISYTAGVRYTATEQVTVSGGISYVDLGDADLSGSTGGAPYDFTDNSALGLGVQVAYKF